MSLHKLTVTCLLTATLVLALGYVSTFPSQAEQGALPPAGGVLESGDVRDAPGQPTEATEPQNARQASMSAWA